MELVAALVTERLVDGIHDVSDGGLAVALAEMAVKSGTGCRVPGLSSWTELFAEGPSRVLVSVPPATIELMTEMAHAARIPATPLGAAGGDRLVLEGFVDLALTDLEAAWKNALPAAFSPTQATGGPVPKGRASSAPGWPKAWLSAAAPAKPGACPSAPTRHCQGRAGPLARCRPKGRACTCRGGRNRP